MADFFAFASSKLRDSASPGWLQPISLRETLLSEKWSRSLRVCLMADFYAMITSCLLPGKIGVFSFRKKTVMLSGGFER